MRMKWNYIVAELFNFSGQNKFLSFNDSFIKISFNFTSFIIYIINICACVCFLFLLYPPLMFGIVETCLKKFGTVHS